MEILPLIASSDVTSIFLNEGLLGAIVVVEAIVIVVLAKYLINALNESSSIMTAWRDDLMKNRDQDTLSRERLAESINNLSDKIETGRGS